jgi:hypothetical protein
MSRLLIIDRWGYLSFLKNDSYHRDGDLPCIFITGQIIHLTHIKNDMLHRVNAPAHIVSTGYIIHAEYGIEYHRVYV